MKSESRRRWLRNVLLALGAGAGVAACGQKGPLFMPPADGSASDKAKKKKGAALSDPPPRA